MVRIPTGAKRGIAGKTGLYCFSDEQITISFVGSRRAPVRVLDRVHARGIRSDDRRSRRSEGFRTSTIGAPGRQTGQRRTDRARPHALLRDPAVQESESQLQQLPRAGSVRR